MGSIKFVKTRMIAELNNNNKTRLFSFAFLTLDPLVLERKSRATADSVVVVLSASIGVVVYHHSNLGENRLKAALTNDQIQRFITERSNTIILHGVALFSHSIINLTVSCHNLH